MSDRHLYEYAVIRYMPRVERGEFINVGLVMMCKRKRWVRAEYRVDPERLAALYGEVDQDALYRQLEAFSAIASGKSLSPIASLEAHERFRWLTAVRSACIQTSRPHPGHCSDLDATFGKLMDELVG